MYSYKDLYKNAKIFENKSDFIDKIFSQGKKLSILDVGFFGQGLDIHNPSWVHSLLKKKGHNVFGIDLNPKISELDATLYSFEVKNAEDFNYHHKYDIVFAGDLIEHLSNPGLFLESTKKSLTKDGQIIISTPNAFNLFNIVEKIGKIEPTVNHEHTCYFNLKTFNELASRYDLEIIGIGFIKNLGITYKESFFKKLQNIAYNFIGLFTPKFLETIVFFLKIKEKI